MKRLAMGVIAAVMSLSAAQASGEELPFGMVAPHLNIVLSVGDPEAVHRFYGEILGLKRIPDIDFPGEPYMIRYLGGETEIKFIVTHQDLPSHPGGADTARGIRFMAILLPASEREGVLSRMDAAGIAPPQFTAGENKAAGYTYEWGMVRDFEDNQVEIVFLDGASEEKLAQLQIALVVSDMAAMDAFLADVMGWTPVVTEGRIHRYEVGRSQVKVLEADGDLPTWIGSPFEKRGYNLVQSIVRDVDAVRETVVARGGKIHTEPFPLGTLATIMFVEGPDGVLFEFAGPLAARFRK